jgi:L-fucose isomerase-like protein
MSGKKATMGMCKLFITVTDICSFNTKFNKMEEDKNLEQNLDKSNKKLHISDVMKRIDELIEEHRQIPLKMKDCKDSFEYDNLDRRLRSLRMLFIELGILKYVS